MAEQNQNQTPNDGKVSYNVQRIVQIGGVQYGSGLYRIPENIARALDACGAGARQEEFIQAVAGNAPVIDASANALNTQPQGAGTAQLASGIVPSGQSEGSPNFIAPLITTNLDSSSGNLNVNDQNPGSGGNVTPPGGAGTDQNHRSEIENQTVKTDESNQTSANQTPNLPLVDPTGAPLAPVTTAPTKGATGSIPEDFPRAAELKAGGINTFEQLTPLTETELLAINGIGKASVRDIGLAVYTLKQQAENQ